MSKLTITGLICWLLGLLILGFQGISQLMHEGTNWKNLMLTDFIEPDYLEWITQVPIFAQNALNYLLHMPLFVLLFCVGTLAFIINAFVE